MHQCGFFVLQLRVPDPPSAATNTIRARPLALRRPSVEMAATGAGAGAGAAAAVIVEVEARVVVAAEVIVVERLSKNINESHLQEIFGQFGRIKDLDLPMNRTFATNRGTAYILYDYEEDAEAAISHMHEAQVDGSAVNVSIVLPRRKLSPAPPTARRGANIDPRVPFSGGRGGPPGAVGSAGIAVALTILTHPGRARDLQDGKGLADMMTTRRDVAAVLMAMTTEVDLEVGGTILDKLLRAKLLRQTLLGLWPIIPLFQFGAAPPLRYNQPPANQLVSNVSMTKAMAILCDVAHFAPGALIMSMYAVADRANKGVYPDVVSSHESKVNMSLCRMGARQVG
ncbi:hypothetical protein FAUST_8265 [Fusarium austroamericanum]|uniref:RRM domain-containing protein n=1 Tax=Fusarium austroamericanum TaxID=282268 RepID=A0AAN6BY33_FUSAU|nr:hypothetical protein FAUST_8265 [Fusarium austroamericanum]